MPAYDPIQDPDREPMIDPYSPDESDSSPGSAFEQGRQNDRNRQVLAQQRKEIIDLHCGEVIESCRLRRERLDLEEKRERFEHEPAFRQRVLRARGDRSFLWFTKVILLVVFTADLLLGTPDLAEYLSHGPASLFAESETKDIEQQKEQDSPESKKPNPAPIWLRLTIGTLIAGAAVLLTLAVKRVGDESKVQRDLRRVGPGDDATWNRLQQALWLRRSIKLGYLLAMIGLFAWLQSFAQSRAITIANQAATADDFEWADLGINLLGSSESSVGDTTETTPTGTEDGTAEEGADLGKGLANGSLAVYVMLFLLHATLLFCPYPATTIDLPLARFSPHRAEKQASALRTQETELLYGIVNRIQSLPAENPLRESLITMSEPVARAVNELYGRTIMPLPDLDDREDTIVAGGNNEDGNDDSPDMEAMQEEISTYDDDDDDPAEAIFGRSA